MAREFSLAIRFVLKDQPAETSMREIVSPKTAELSALAAQHARAVLSFVEGAGEILSLDLAHLLPNESGLSRIPRPASSQELVSGWSYDTSGIVVRSDDDAPKNALKVTPEMLEAGMKVMRERDSRYGDTDIADVEDIFLTMYAVMATGNR